MSSITDSVREQYAAVAKSGLSSNVSAVKSVAAAFGYTADELASLPAEANMGLSCGNPVAMAGLRSGEVVVDLGCGGGLDVLLASKIVGATGRAIGIDMTPEMLQRARAGATKVGATNVEFHLAQIDELPLQDDSVDCILSNCVINLAPDKPKVFREMFRVLKAGGRISISDIALRKPLPAAVAESLQAYVGCIAGAMLVEDYVRLLTEAGFEAVVVSETGTDLNVYAQASASGCCGSEPVTGCCSPSAATDLIQSPVHEGLTEVFREFNVNEFAASVRVYATKGRTMKSIQIYDRPMCCSTGICGPSVDPVLPRFAADLDTVKHAGHSVERFNLAQQPQAFIENAEIHGLISSKGTDVLPVVVVDGRVVSRGIYPSLEMLQMWCGTVTTPASAPVTASATKGLALPIADQGCCDGPTGCC